MQRPCVGVWMLAIMVLCSSCANDEPPVGREESAVTAAGYKRAPCAAGRNEHTDPQSVCVDMYVVAHHDDDLLFINPDIQTSIQNGNNVIVAYLTASQTLETTDPYFELQWTQRERGILSAYQHMSGTNGPWQTSTPAAPNGKKFAQYVRPLSAQYPNRTVTLAFFRLGDGGLEILWGGSRSSYSCSTADCPLPLESQEFTRASLIDTLAWLMETSYVDSVSTLDLTNINYSVRGGPPDNYADMGSHIMAGVFATAAVMKYQASAANTPRPPNEPPPTKHLRVYRGYSAPQEPRNLSNAERNAKFEIFNYYRHWDCAVGGVPCGAEKPACGTPDQCGDPNNCDVNPNAPPPANCGPCDTGDAACRIGTPGQCPEERCPKFDQHWQRTYTTRSLLGNTHLQGRLGVGSGCISTAGFVTLPRAGAVASSEYPGWPASLVMDGNGGTRWSSTYADPQWIYIDLGSPRYITRVRLAWEAAYATAYQIQVSNDAVSWVTKWSTTTGSGGTVEISLPPNTVGQYVRMYGTQRGTPWGYSIWEFNADTFAALTASNTCGSAPSWTITRTQQIQLTGTSNCLVGNAASSAIDLAACAPQSPWSTFFLMSNGQILSNPDTSTSQVTTFLAGSECMTASPSGALVHGYCDKRCINETTGVIEDCESRYQACLGTCPLGFGCQETASGSRCLRGCSTDSDCIAGREVCRGYLTAQGAGQACVPLPTGLPVTGQDWTLLFDTPALRTTQFSDATEIDSASAYYRTFGIGNQNVCVRRGGGVYCAPYSNGAFGTALQLTSGFSDGSGWINDASGSTVGVAWDPTVIPSGQLIACGRGYYGATCTTGGTSSFSTAEGWDAGPYYYNSIRYTDVSGDGKPDICGRGYWGLSCSRNLGTSFTTATAWSSNFAYAGGWNSNGVGDTVQFGDINGDGKADVCARGDFGIACEVGNYSSFSNYRVWSFDSDRRVGVPDAWTSVNFDFSNTDVTAWKSSSAYYASLKLIDVNHDGFADLCGRGSQGIFCAFSVGSGFARKRLVLSDDFTDGFGWGVANKGATISFGNLDGDARVDVCGRGYYGIVCGEGY